MSGIVHASQTTPAHFIALDMLAPKLGLTSVKKAAETVRRLVRDSIIGPDDFTHQTVPKIEADDFPVRAHQKMRRGRPALTYFLSPLGAMALAMHTRTPEAAAWRQAQIGNLVKRFEEPSGQLAFEVASLRERVERLEATGGHRERRSPPSPQADIRDELVQAWAEAQAMTDSPDGMTAAEALRAAPRILSRFGRDPRSLGYALRSAAGHEVNGVRLTSRIGHAKIAIWQTSRDHSRLN